MNRSKPDDSRDSLLDQLRVDQAACWERGERRFVEAYLRERPELAADVDLLLDLIYSEILVREATGDQPEIDEYAQRFPSQADSLRRLWDVHRALPSTRDEAGDGRGVESLQRDTREFGASERHAAGESPDTGEVREPPALPEIPGYELLGEIGRGGMGVVYRARHVRLGRLVALKLLRGAALPDAEQRERFDREAQAVARLQHPHIVQIFDGGEHEGRPYLAFELVEGGNLVAWTSPPLHSPRQCAALVETLARGIGHAHRNGIVHRDLKPANILLAPRPADARSAGGTAGDSASGSHSLAPLEPLDCVPKITDFGLAKRIADEVELTHSAAFLGTGAYMSPEQAWGRARDVGPATDVHALGMILFELLTGRNPYRDDTLMRTLDRVRFETPAAPSELRAEVPESLDAICLRCLAKEPSERYASADELAEDLGRFLANEPLPRRASPARRRPSLRSVTLASLALVALVGAVAGWKAVERARRDDARPKSAGDEPGALAEPGESATATVPRTRGERFAFLVGVRSYRFPDGSIDLEYTEADVDELSRMLLKQGVPRQNIRLLTQWSEADNPELAPTGANIRRQLKKLLVDCIPDDSVLVAVTGMGGESGAERTYCYLPSDARVDDAASLMSLGEFFELFRESPARQKLLLVDTCQTAALGDFVWPVVEPPAGSAALFACSSQEASYEHAKLRHGVFSYHVLRGLEGAADANADRAVTLAELYDFSRAGVQEFLAREMPDAVQTPRLVRSSDVSRSDWVLARPTP